MRATAYLIALVSFALIADVSSQCADRTRAGSAKQNDAQVRVAVEDWAVSSYLACGLGATAVGWAAVASASGVGRLSRLARPIARLGTCGSAVGGLALAVGLGGWFVLSGEYGDGPVRYDLESLWLIGAAFGGGAGSAIGAGLGVVALGRPRPQDAEPGAAADGGGMSAFPAS